MFHVGQEVVCIRAPKDDIFSIFWIPIPVGNVHKIRDIYISSDDGKLGLLFKDITNVLHPNYGTELGYNAERFRPIQKKQTDISALKSLLNPINHKELEDA